MKRRFRLKKSTDFQRVRRAGKSYAHPLVVLIAYPNEGQATRFGVAAGRSLGGAVQRNRARRLLRAGLASLIPRVLPGWDVVLLARGPLLAVRAQEAQSAIQALLGRAKLLRQNDAV